MKTAGLLLTALPLAMGGKLTFGSAGGSSIDLGSGGLTFTTSGCVDRSNFCFPYASSDCVTSSDATLVTKTTISLGSEVSLYSDNTFRFSSGDGNCVGIDKSVPTAAQLSASTDAKLAQLKFTSGDITKARIHNDGSNKLWLQATNLFEGSAEIAASGCFMEWRAKSCPPQHGGSGNNCQHTLRTEGGATGTGGVSPGGPVCNCPAGKSRKMVVGGLDADWGNRATFLTQGGNNPNPVSWFAECIVTTPAPTKQPTPQPTNHPTNHPTADPTAYPTKPPTAPPTDAVASATFSSAACTPKIYLDNGQGCRHSTKTYAWTCGANEDGTISPGCQAKRAQDGPRDYSGQNIYVKTGTSTPCAWPIKLNECEAKYTTRDNECITSSESLDKQEGVEFTKDSPRLGMSCEVQPWFFADHFALEKISQSSSRVKLVYDAPVKISGVSMQYDAGTDDAGDIKMTLQIKNERYQTIGSNDCSTTRGSINDCAASVPDADQTGSTFLVEIKTGQSGTQSSKWAYVGNWQATCSEVAAEAPGCDMEWRSRSCPPEHGGSSNNCQHTIAVHGGATGAGGVSPGSAVCNCPAGTTRKMTTDCAECRNAGPLDWDWGTRATMLTQGGNNPAPVAWKIECV